MNPEILRIRPKLFLGMRIYDCVFNEWFTVTEAFEPYWWPTWTTAGDFQLPGEPGCPPDPECRKTWQAGDSFLRFEEKVHGGYQWYHYYVEDVGSEYLHVKVGHLTMYQPIIQLAERVLYLPHGINDVVFHEVTQ